MFYIVTHTRSLLSDTLTLSNQNVLEFRDSAKEVGDLKCIHESKHSLNAFEHEILSNRKCPKLTLKFLSVSSFYLLFLSLCNHFRFKPTRRPVFIIKQSPQSNLSCDFSLTLFIRVEPVGLTALFGKHSCPFPF